MFDNRDCCWEPWMLEEKESQAAANKNNKKQKENDSRADLSDNDVAIKAQGINWCSAVVGEHLLRDEVQEQYS